MTVKSLAIVRFLRAFLVALVVLVAWNEAEGKANEPMEPLAWLQDRLADLIAST